MNLIQPQAQKGRSVGTNPPPNSDAVQIQPSTGGLKEDMQQWMAKAMQIVHSKDTRGKIMMMLQSSAKDPVQAVANVTTSVMQQVDMITRRAGIEVDDGVKFAGAHELIGQVEEIARMGRLFSLDQRHQELALSVAVQDYVKGEIAAKRIDPYKLQAKIKAGVQAMSPKDKIVMEQSVKRLADTSKSYIQQRGK